MLLVKKNEGRMYLLEWVPKIFQVGPDMHRISPFSSQILCVNNICKQFVDDNLEELDTLGKRTPKGVIEEREIGEEVMTNNDVILMLELYDNRIKLDFLGLPLLLNIFAASITEPRWIDT